MKKRILLLILVTALAASVLSLNSCSKDEASGSENTGGVESTDGDVAGTDAPGIKNNSTVTKHHYGEFDYWLYTPDSAEEDLPLIVYLHDKSDGGQGIDEMIEKEGLTQTLYEGGLRVNAYVLMPNLSDAQKSWYSMRSPLEELISHVSVAINSSRIYLTGVGKGATGVYEIAMSTPNKFAAFAPVGGEIADHADTEKLKDVRLTAYVSVDLDEPGAESIMDFMFELGKINASIEIFTLENYNTSNYVTLYSDMEYHLLQSLIGD